MKYVEVTQADFSHLCCIPISMDLSFIWRILNFSVASKNLELNFSLVMLQILSCLYNIFVLSYALLKPKRHQIPCQVAREEFLRALPLNSTTTFPDYMAGLNFTALKFIFISWSFFPMDCYLLSSIFIRAWMTVCHCLVVFLVSFFTFSCLFFSGVVFLLNLNSYWFRLSMFNVLIGTSWNICPPRIFGSGYFSIITFLPLLLHLTFFPDYAYLCAFKPPISTFHVEE